MASFSTWDQTDLSALRGKSAIVIGGASGLGLAIVKRFIEAGAHVTIADLDVERSSRIVLPLRKEGYPVNFVRCDVTDYASSVKAFEYAMKHSPQHAIDIAVLTAGVVGQAGSLVDLVIAGRHENPFHPPKARHPGLDVNLMGIYNCAYLALWYMSQELASGFDVKEKPADVDLKTPKSLILISSTVAYTDVPKFADYHISKFGIRGLFRGLRHESPRLNIRANCLAPYFLDTPLVQNDLKTFADAGMAPGKGFTFASMDRAVDTVGMFAASETVHGRVVAILPEPEGVIDLRDDEQGLWGASVFKGVQERLRAKGNII